MVELTREQAAHWREHYARHATYWEKWAQPMAEQQEKVNQLLLDAAGVSEGMRVLDLASGAGEPAMTIVPTYLVTGLLAIFFSSAFLVLLVRRGLDTKAIPILFALLVLMLLMGGGFGPPILGTVAILIAFKRNAPLKTWSKLPSKLHRVFGKLWSWSFGLCLTGWLMLFPGAALIVFFTGMDDALLMLIPILIALTFIPITLLLGFSRDVLKRKSEHLNLSQEILPQMQ